MGALLFRSFPGVWEGITVSAEALGPFIGQGLRSGSAQSENFCEAPPLFLQLLP